MSQRGHGNRPAGLRKARTSGEMRVARSDGAGGNGSEGAWVGLTAAVTDGHPAFSLMDVAVMRVFGVGGRECPRRDALVALGHEDRHRSGHDGG
jgi:hypothetical protein